MKGAANVTSLEAVKCFRGALSSFLEEASEALGMADLSMRRVVNWIEHDQRAYWQGQLRRRQKEVARARLELDQRRLSGTKGHKPDCIEQSKALRAARLRLEEAEEKIDKVRHWSRTARRAVEEYRGQVQTFRNLVDEDPPRALVVFDKITAALDSYVALAPPVTTARPETGSPSALSIGIADSPDTPQTETSEAQALSRDQEESFPGTPNPSPGRKACEPPR